MAVQNKGREGPIRKLAPTTAIRESASEGQLEGTLSGRLTMIVLPDADGREVRLGSLWAAQPAVVVFLRHYG